MDLRSRIAAVQRAMAAATVRRQDRHDSVGWESLPLVPFVAGLTAPSASRRLLWLARGARRIRRRRLRRVLRVLAEASSQRRVLGFQPRDAIHEPRNLRL